MNTITALTRGPRHHFFGYYGVDSWDRDQRYHLALETDFHNRRPRPNDRAAVGVVDLQTGRFIPHGHTAAFNLQQGTMMHWIEVGFGEEFTYNDWEESRLVARAVNPQTGTTRTIQGAIAAVSPTEPVAIGLDFARMAHCRAVVGYANEADPSAISAIPEDDGLFLLDLKTGDSKLILSIADLTRARPCPDAAESPVWLNHVYFSPDGCRLLFLCRVRRDGSWCSSMWSVGVDGSGLECQIGYEHKISHFAWRDAERIIVSADVLGTMQFVEFRDCAQDFRPFGAGLLPQDGHACFSPDGRWLVCDTYPQGPERMRELMLYNIQESRKVSVGAFHSPEPFVKDVRCDLHPRWRRDGRRISFDSIHEGTRQIYAADVADIVA